MTKSIKAVLVAASFSLGAAACSQDKPPVDPSHGNATTARSSKTALNDTSKQNATLEKGNGLVISKELRERCGIPANSPVAKFDFDSSLLLPEERTALDSLAKCLTDGALRGENVQLVGRTDPRGETEYNFVLGSYRAEAVAAYLRSLGVTPSRVNVTSRGELDATGHDEETWAGDRRVDVGLFPHS